MRALAYGMLDPERRALPARGDPPPRMSGLPRLRALAARARGRAPAALPSAAPRHGGAHAARCARRGARLGQGSCRGRGRGSRHLGRGGRRGRRPRRPGERRGRGRAVGDRRRGRRRGGRGGGRGRRRLAAHRRPARGQARRGLPARARASGRDASSSARAARARSPRRRGAVRAAPTRGAGVGADATGGRGRREPAALVPASGPARAPLAPRDGGRSRAGSRRRPRVQPRARVGLRRRRRGKAPVQRLHVGRDRIGHGSAAAAIGLPNASSRPRRHPREAPPGCPRSDRLCYCLREDLAEARERERVAARAQPAGGHRAQRVQSLADDVHPVLVGEAQAQVGRGRGALARPRSSRSSRSDARSGCRGR